MIPSNVQIQKMIRCEASKGMAIAELEYLGLSLRVINTLEEKVGIVYIQQLIDKSETELLFVRQLGLGAIQQIMAALERFPELENERQRWHKGSECTEYYKNKIDTRTIFTLN